MVEFQVIVPWKNGLGNAKAVQIARLMQKYPLVDVIMAVGAAQANGHDMPQLKNLKAKKGDKVSVTLIPINGEQEKTINMVKADLENFFLKGSDKQ